MHQRVEHKELVSCRGLLATKGLENNKHIKLGQRANLLATPLCHLPEELKEQSAMNNGSSERKTATMAADE